MGELFDILRSHRLDEDGAVTIDWVVTSSLSLLLGLAVGYVIFNVGVASLAADLSAIILSAGDIGPDAVPATGSGN